MVMTSGPARWRGHFLSAASSGQRKDPIVPNPIPKPINFAQLTVAEFARLSSSMQLSLLAIRRAQQSSRKAVAELAATKKGAAET